MQKKKLDELFQEKFLDFKETPDNKVWRAIDASLDKKKKKRIIPIWWQLSGIAAALAVGLLIFNPFSNIQETNEIIVDTNKKANQNNDIQSKSINQNLEDTLKIENDVVAQKDAKNSTEFSKDVTSKVVDNNQSSDSKHDIINAKEKWSQNKNAIVENNLNEEKSDNNSMAIAESTNLESTNKSDKRINIISQNEKKGGLALNGDKVLNVTGEKIIESKESSAVAVNGLNIEKHETTEEGKKSIFEEIDAQEEKIKVASENNRWSAGPNIAPVYFNAVGKGSPVNSIFVPNSKSGNINLSYGVSVAYAVSKKLTIRSGINKVDYGYDTEDVSFSSSQSSLLGDGQLATIDYAETSNTLTISSKKVTSEKFSTVSNSFDASAKSAAREGFMSQQIGYIELPVEMNYALIDNKFGVNIIGGVSSLFLIDNAVSLTSGELTTEIGEANNINDVNFSANMGLGFNYKFSPTVRFNLEPIFKYQLNTFSEIDGTFRPYSIGVYSGLTFKF